jgi:hypothetical protein
MARTSYSLVLYTTLCGLEVTLQVTSVTLMSCFCSENWVALIGRGEQQALSPRAQPPILERMCHLHCNVVPHGLLAQPGHCLRF